jgi:hypothetical protein
VYKGRTMEQYYRTTKPVFTTNWYLYKTQVYQCRVKREENNKTINYYSAKKREGNNRLKNKTLNITDSFEDIFLEAVDESLSIIGEPAKNTVYNYLKRTFKMNKQEIPYRIDEYITAIEKMFGTGAKIIQIQTLKKLYKKVGCEIKHYPNHKNLTFIEYISTMKLEKEKRENNKKQNHN